MTTIHDSPLMRVEVDPNGVLVITHKTRQGVSVLVRAMGNDLHVSTHESQMEPHGRKQVLVWNDPILKQRSG